MFYYLFLDIFWLLTTFASQILYITIFFHWVDVFLVYVEMVFFSVVWICALKSSQIMGMSLNLLNLLFVITFSWVHIFPEAEVTTTPIRIKVCE